MRLLSDLGRVTVHETACKVITHTQLKGVVRAPTLLGRRSCLPAPHPLSALIAQVSVTCGTYGTHHVLGAYALRSNAPPQGAAQQNTHTPLGTRALLGPYIAVPRNVCTRQCARRCRACATAASATWWTQTS